MLDRQPSRNLSPSGCGAVSRLPHEHAIQPKRELGPAQSPRARRRILGHGGHHEPHRRGATLPQATK